MPFARHAHGRSQTLQQDVEQGRAPPRAATSTDVDTAAPRTVMMVDNIPDISHSKSQQLMSGEVNIDVKALSLQMLLARLKDDVAGSDR